MLSSAGHYSFDLAAITDFASYGETCIAAVTVSELLAGGKFTKKNWQQHTVS